MKSDLSKLIKFCTDFNINIDDIDWHGEHDVVYIHLPKKYYTKSSFTPDMFPQSKDYTSEDEYDIAREAFSDKYGLTDPEGYFGFYT